jgi:hypothetical protein
MPGERVQIYFNGGELLATVDADGGGNFQTGEVSVPTDGTGYTQYILAGESSHMIVAFDVTWGPLTPHMEIFADTLRPGGTIAIKGGGFAPDECVMLSINGNTSAHMSDGGGNVGFDGVILPATVMPLTITLSGEESGVGVTQSWYANTAMTSTVVSSSASSQAAMSEMSSETATSSLSPSPSGVASSQMSSTPASSASSLTY